jgi:hypothetical protein
VLGAAASPASASVTIGQVGVPVVSLCETGSDLAQPSVTAGNSYVVPGTGTITSWTTYGGPNPTSPLTMKVFRLVTPPATYQAVGHAGPQPVAANGTGGNTFPADIQVKPGDVLGLDGGSYCLLDRPGEHYIYYVGSLADGGPPQPFGTAPNFRLNIQAAFEPANTFTLGNTTRNKKRGTATLTFDLPNPGQLSGTGKGAKVSVASPDAVGSVVAPGAGPTNLRVKAKGKKMTKLNDTGKVKLSLSVTYTPTGGDPRTQKLKLKLLKN